MPLPACLGCTEQPLYYFLKHSHPLRFQAIVQSQCNKWYGLFYHHKPSTRIRNTMPSFPWTTVGFLSSFPNLFRCPVAALWTIINLRSIFTIITEQIPIRILVTICNCVAIQMKISLQLTIMIIFPGICTNVWFFTEQHFSPNLPGSPISNVNPTHPEAIHPLYSPV